jgi:hypothetical protein
MDYWFIEDKCPICAAQMVTDGARKWCVEEPEGSTALEVIKKTKEKPAKKKKESTGRKPHLCKFCGETDPAKFYRTMKSTCKKCQKSNEIKRQQSMGKAKIKCAKCGKEREVNAYTLNAGNISQYCSSCGTRMAFERKAKRVKDANNKLAKSSTGNRVGNKKRPVQAKGRHNSNVVDPASKNIPAKKKARSRDR